jgi:site-specific recombinase XerC
LNYVPKFKDSDDLMIMRDLAMIVLSFAGFLRFDELSSLKCNDWNTDTLFSNVSAM